MGESHPSRVRGLKFEDELKDYKIKNVAPFAGAWIEIKIRQKEVTRERSHPSRVRGLK